MENTIQFNIGDLILNIMADDKKKDVYMYVYYCDELYVSIQTTIYRSDRESPNCYSFFDNFNKLIEYTGCAELFECALEYWLCIDVLHLESKYNELGYCFESVDIEFACYDDLAAEIRQSFSKLKYEYDRYKN